MKIEMTKKIKGNEIEVEVIAGKKIGGGQSTKIEMAISVDGEKISNSAVYNAKAKGVMLNDYGSTTIIQGQKISGFRLSPKDAEVLETHINKENAEYAQKIDERVQSLLTGEERVKVWRSGSTIMVTLHKDHTGLDWQEIIRKAAKKWIKDRYPLVASYQSDNDDLHRGIMFPIDAMGLPGAEASEEVYKTMGGDTHPEHVLVPITSFLTNASKKYEKIQTEGMADANHRAHLMSIAKETGKKQVLSSYLSDGCLDHLEDCSFDVVTVWIDVDGKVSQTHSHCH